MIADNRRAQIVNLVRKENNISCAALSDALNVTPETIRRDLTYLDEKGLLIRTHGGAVAIQEELRSTELRLLENIEQKRLIAETASSLLTDNDVIYLDAGTTTQLICDYISSEKELYVITNSKKCIDKLVDKSKVTLISTGGILRRKTMAFTGSYAEQTIKSYTLNKAFISAMAVSTKFGIMDSHQDEANLNRIAIGNAKEIYLLADSSKFNKIAYINVASLENITAIITDDNLDGEIEKELHDKNIDVLIAKDEEQ